MKKTFLFIFLLTLVSLGYAQTFSVELESAIPLGDFAKDDISDEDEFGAGLGFNLGG